MRKVIKGYTRYTVDKQGVIRSRLTNKVLKWHDIKNHGNRGPFQVHLVNDEGKRKPWLVHRLVAITFIPNINHKPQVNHKDGDLSNNNVKNLEWVTGKENVQHAYEVLGRPGSNWGKKEGNSSFHRPILMRKGTSIRRFKSIKGAARILGVHVRSISKQLRGERKQLRGMTFEYRK